MVKIKWTIQAEMKEEREEMKGCKWKIFLKRMGYVSLKVKLAGQTAGY